MLTLTTTGAGAEAGKGFRHYLKYLLFVVAIVVPCALVYHVASPSVAPFFASFVMRGQKLDGSVELDQKYKDDVNLERILKAAAMENRTVILTTLNAAWASPGTIIDIFLESFRMGNGTQKLLDHLVIVAMDREAYLRCQSIHSFCFSLVTKGVDFSKEKPFMSNDYLLMMWRRIAFLRTILEKGYSFIFTDADIMWFRNPLPHFLPDVDFQISCDRFSGNPSDLSNSPNGGFLYAKANNRSIEFYKYWYLSRERYPGNHDQDVLNYIKRDSFISEIGLQIRFLRTTYFGGICEPSRDFSQVCTMHANCCVGLKRKLNDMRVMLEDWRTYLSSPLSAGRYDFKWRVPQICSMDPIV